MNPEKKISLRPVTDADDDFLFSVYASTRAEEMSRVPWSPEQKDSFVRMQYAAQKRHYPAQYPGAAHDIIILADGTAVGRIYLDRAGEELHILDITVLPEYRNAGIGSWLLRQVLDEAATKNKPVTIYLENFNPSLRLFERLGFQKAEENGFQLLMRKEPVSR